MNFEINIVFLLEVIGTISFAISGAMIGVKKKMDIFGICVLGVTTSVGGGMIRDVILGNVPSSLISPIYVVMATISSICVFLTFYFKKSFSTEKSKKRYDNIMLSMDALGLGIFTVMGINVGITNGYSDYTFLLIFLGVLTGVGGGLVRDMMANVTPYILTKDIYAFASIVGAICCVVSYRIFGELFSSISTVIIVTLIRFLATHYNWNLPRIKNIFN